MTLCSCWETFLAETNSSQGISIRNSLRRPRRKQCISAEKPRAWHYLWSTNTNSHPLLTFSCVACLPSIISMIIPIPCFRIAPTNRIPQRLLIKHNQRITRSSRFRLHNIPMLHHTTPIHSKHINNDSIHALPLRLLRCRNLFRHHPTRVVTQTDLCNSDIQWRYVFGESILCNLSSGFEIGVMLDVRFCDVGLERGWYVFRHVEEFDKVLEDAKLFRGRDLTTWTVWCRIRGDGESSCGKEVCEFHGS